jgi:hypothetical protein
MFNPRTVLGTSGVTATTRSSALRLRSPHERRVRTHRSSAWTGDVPECSQPTLLSVWTCFCLISTLPRLESCGITQAGVSAGTPRALLSRLGPGLAIAAAVALIARLAARLLPESSYEVLLAVVIGILVANTGRLSASVGPGVRFAVRRILRLGIILLGARLSLGAVWALGIQTLGLVIICMTVALAIALTLGRLLKLPPRLTVLIGVGTAVCGNSAIVATAPAIRADEHEVSFAVSTITIFGTAAVFLYPLVGHLLGLSDVAFGVWSGVSVNDTSQVVAASAAYSLEARDVATDCRVGVVVGAARRRPARKHSGRVVEWCPLVRAGLSGVSASPDVWCRRSILRADD